MRRLVQTFVMVIVVGLPMSAIARESLCPDMRPLGLAHEAAAVAAGPAKGLAGSWMGHVATGMMPPFPFLMTAGRGGDLIVSQAILVPFPAPGGRAVFTPAHGEWVQRGNEVHFTFLALIFDENAIPLGSSRVEGTIEVARDGGSFTGAATASSFDSTGVLLYSFDATLIASRIAAVP